MHQRNLQFLMTEIYEIKNNHSPPIVHQLFQFCENTFHLRNITELVTHNKKMSSKLEQRFFGLDCHLNMKTQQLQPNFKQKGKFGRWSNLSLQVK